MQKVEFWCVEREFSDKGKVYSVNECETAEKAFEKYVSEHDLSPGIVLTVQGIGPFLRMVVE